ncbi:MAG: hypothetical protein KKI08_23750 [Armatimonadetes bacterium]|nr:hypothetical protein [Armatimonadota bacterium]
MDTAETSVHDLALRRGALFQHFESQLLCTDVRAEVVFALERRGLPREGMLSRVDEALAAVAVVAARLQLHAGELLPRI